MYIARVYTTLNKEGKLRPPPSQKALSSVVHHSAWVAHTRSLTDFDARKTDSPMPHREATRFLSASQPCAGSWLDAGLTDTRIRQHNESPAFLTAEQRRLGLYLTTVVLAGLPGALGQ
jgi:hypothetical protein